jgi:7-carboxy-7-deazaguanine synthase
MPVAEAPSDRVRRTSRASFPVVEIFGPTVQGEGPDAGVPAYFVRFGGCDWRCSWCDSLHAVDPRQVRQNSEALTAEAIKTRLGGLPAGPELVVLSGGNPALLELGDLVRKLRADKKRVAVETQGSRWKAWLRDVDRLVISPKPPSSGMAGEKQQAEVASFLSEAAGHPGAALKLVVFDAQDLDWAADCHRSYPRMPLYLSAGTDVGLDDAATIETLRSRYRWLCETVSQRSDLARARVFPQLHVVAWGTAKGV